MPPWQSWVGLGWKSPHLHHMFQDSEKLNGRRAFAGPWAQQFEAGTMKPTNDSGVKDTLQGTNISPKNGILKMIFLFPRWDMLIPWRVRMCFFFWGRKFPQCHPGEKALLFPLGGGVALGRYPALDDHECFNFWIPPLLCFLSLLLMPADYDDSWWFYMYICRFLYDII